MAKGSKSKKGKNSNSVAVNNKCVNCLILTVFILAVCIVLYGLFKGLMFIVDETHSGLVTHAQVPNGYATLVSSKSSGIIPGDELSRGAFGLLCPVPNHAAIGLDRRSWSV